MSDLEPLILDMLGWLAREPRVYADVLDAWRTSCPRLTVWEDALDRGLIERQKIDGRVFILPSAEGRRMLKQRASVP